jgi:uncharacterized protein YndB with AHSA1/START domain
MRRTDIVAEPGLPQVVVSREFRAPRDLLFRAHVDPALLTQWLGPRQLTLTVDHLEARHGGTWRHVSTDPDGDTYCFRGVFHGDPSVDGIVQTWEAESRPGHVCMSTITFEEREGGTLLRQSTVFQSVQDRDWYAEAGMEIGVNESMERLRKLLEHDHQEEA